MFKKENIRKNFFRGKQIADQYLGRAEKSEVLSDDIQTADNRVVIVKQVCQNTVKKLGAGFQGPSTDPEKRLKKMPEAVLGLSMIESANLLGPDELMGQMFQMCGECESNLANTHMQYELDIERNVIKPIEEILEQEIPQISKLKKQLNKVTLDMDSAKTRWNQAVRQTQVPGVNMASASTKADQVKDELEETSNRVDQAKDALTTGIFNFMSRDAEHSKNLLALMETQVIYHKKALAELEKTLPKMNDLLNCTPSKPVYGTTLEEHLRVTNRDIAVVLDVCINYLLETGLEEEGLFRIAGMASKLKKLKASFDAGIDYVDSGEMDQHTVAGALKQYLRELPEPLLTFALYQPFVDAVQQPQDKRLQALWCVVDRLPKPNYDNFRYLIKFLAKLTEQSDVNKMTPSNIAIVIGPNLIWSEGDNGPNMMNTGMLSLITELIVQHADWFFPGELDFHLTVRGSSPPHCSSQGRASEQVESSHSLSTSAMTTGGSSTTVSPAISRTSTNRRASGPFMMAAMSPGPSCGPDSSANGVGQSRIVQFAHLNQRRPSEDAEKYLTAKDINFMCGPSTEINTSIQNRSYDSVEHAELERTSSSQSGSSQGTQGSLNSPSNQEAHSQLQAPPSTPPTVSRSPSISPVSSSPNLSQGAPLAESEDLPTPMSRRTIRKAAPRPPERPYSVAVSASVKQREQFQTWPRHTDAPTQPEMNPLTANDRDKLKTLPPPERPHPPERVSSNPGHHGPSHSDRPKIPPPVVPSHQRSASTGAAITMLPTQTTIATTSAPSEAQQGYLRWSTGTSDKENKTGTL